MASILYNRFKSEMLKGNVPWESGALKVLLVNPSYIPDPDHVFVSQASANELSGTGYIPGFAGSGRQLLAGKVIVQDDTNDRAAASAIPNTWLAISAGVAAWALIYKPGTLDTDSILVGGMDVPDVMTNGTDISVVWPDVSVGGIFYF